MLINNKDELFVITEGAVLTIIGANEISTIIIKPMLKMAANNIKFDKIENLKGSLEASDVT